MEVCGIFSKQEQGKRKVKLTPWVRAEGAVCYGEEEGRLGQWSHGSRVPIWISDFDKTRESSGTMSKDSSKQTLMLRYKFSSGKR